MHFNWTCLILIAVGFYGLLGAFRVVRLSKNPEANDLWLREFCPLMKVLCPLVMLFGLGQFFGLFR